MNVPPVANVMMGAAGVQPFVQDVGDLAPFVVVVDDGACRDAVRAGEAEERVSGKGGGRHAVPAIGSSGAGSPPLISRDSSPSSRSESSPVSTRCASVVS